MKIKDCVAIVSGGASGLGEAVVRDIVAEGGKAAVFDLDAENGKKLAAELGDAVIFCEANVTDEASIQAAVDNTVKSLGAIHAVVNCAGVVIPAKVIDKKGKPISLDLFNKVIQVNLVGTMNILRLAAEKMIQNTPNDDGERGVVINVASVAAFEGQVGQAAYSASKAGVVGRFRKLHAITLFMT